LFQSGWFVESRLTQTLIIHIIRTEKIPFLESRASAALITTTIVVGAVGIALPFTWLGGFLGFVPLPPAYWMALGLILASYVTLTHFVKTGSFDVLIGAKWLLHIGLVIGSECLIWIGIALRILSPRFSPICAPFRQRSVA
jgi:hypothetical protein